MNKTIHNTISDKSSNYTKHYTRLIKQQCKMIQIHNTIPIKLNNFIK